MKRMDEKELADRLGVSVRTVQKWRRTEVGPAYIVVGEHTVRYREEDVIAYELSRKRGGEAIPEPPGWRVAMLRAAECLSTVAGWKNIRPQARQTVASIRDELNALMGK